MTILQILICNSLPPQGVPPLSGIADCIIRRGGGAYTQEKKVQGGIITGFYSMILQ